MKSEKNHLKFLFKAASSENLFKNSPVTYCVAVNDYRYYKTKFLLKYNKKTTIDFKEPELWRQVKAPYEGKKKYGFKSRGKIEHWYNTPWTIKKQEIPSTEYN